MRTIAQYENLEILSDDFLVARKRAIGEFAESETVKALAERLKERTLLVLGGDGTMLRAIRERHGDGLPFLGINFGTKGFLLNRAEDLQDGGEFSTVRYPLLDVTTETSEGKKSGIAFNEAQIKTAGGHMVTLDVSIGGHSEIRLRGDGLLVVTPAGSTGYNASAWGPILPHSSKLLLATPLLSFEPKRAVPAVFEESETVRIVHSAERGQTLSVFADSEGVLESYGSRVEIIVRKRLEAVRLLIPKKTIRAWKRKIFEEQGFKPANSHH